MPHPTARFFPFHHGRVSLSLAGTIGDRGSLQTERLGSPEALAEWLVAAGVVTGAPMPSAASYRRALRLREAIARAARSVADGEKPAASDIATLNATARRWSSRLALDAETLELRDAVRDPAEAALGRIAHDAIELLGDAAERARLRTCGLTSCGSVFLTPPAGRERRWCSMARCGNRAKVTAFRHRTKQTQAR